jgi:hypothetical protein
VRAVLLVAAAAILAVAAVAHGASTVDPSLGEIDGCRGQGAIIRREAPNWAYVGEAGTRAEAPPPAPQWAKGVARSQYEPWMAVHPTGVDNPVTHTAYDLILNVDLDPEYRFLLSGDPSARTGSFRSNDEKYGRLHSEWQEDAFPLWAWPDRGDRVELKGSWVWDCDHIEGGPHTEFHPFRAIWAIRNGGAPSPRSPRGETEATLFVSTLKTPAGTEADCNHRAKGDAAAFRACVRTDPDWQDVNGEYRFFLPAPPRPTTRARLQVRAVDRGSTRNVDVAVRPRGRGAEVAFTIDRPAGERVVVAKQVFAGWGPMPERALPQHVRVTFRELLTRRAMDPGCIGTGCTTPETEQGNQLTRAPGEWVLYWNVAGVWGRWSPVVVPARSGARFRTNRRVDVYLPARRAWRVFVYGRECDHTAFNARGDRAMSPCPSITEAGHPVGDDVPGALEARFASVRRALGRHRRNAMTLDDSTCPRAANPRGCYQVTFDVARIRDERERARQTR